MKQSANDNLSKNNTTIHYKFPSISWNSYARLDMCECVFARCKWSTKRNNNSKNSKSKTNTDRHHCFFFVCPVRFVRSFVRPFVPSFLRSFACFVGWFNRLVLLLFCSKKDLNVTIIVEIWPWYGQFAFFSLSCHIVLDSHMGLHTWTIETDMVEKNKNDEEIIPF